MRPGAARCCRRRTWYDSGLMKLFLVANHIFRIVFFSLNILYLLSCRSQPISGNNTVVRRAASRTHMLSRRHRTTVRSYVADVDTFDRQRTGALSIRRGAKDLRAQSAEEHSTANESA
jgi:hypothetical protein